MFIAASAVALFGISCQRHKGNTHIPELETYVGSLFQASISNAEIAGGTVLVFKHYSTILKKSYGMASLELSAPIPEDVQFEIGSVTKQFASAAILNLVECGKLILEDDLQRLFAI